MLTQIWLELMPTTWSPVTARPTWAPTERTPGSARSSLLTRVVMRCVSACEVPGGVAQFTSSSRSFSAGSSDWPSNGQPRATAASTASRAPTQTLRGRADRAPQRRIVAFAEAFARAATAGARAAPSAAAARSSAGVTVSATTIDASTAST